MFTIKNHLEKRDGHLTIGGVDTVDLVEEYGTPLYVTNEQRVRDNFRRYRKAFPGADMYYAAKANGNFTIMRILAQEGAGADVFGDGELYMALLAGIPREKILFNGNSKTDRELEMAVKTGVRVSVDSLDELNTLSRIAKSQKRIMNIAFRVNPDVSPDTHPKISTGLKTSKFGIPHQEVVAAYKEAIELEGVNPIGMHCHIGSQILDTSPFGEAINRMMDLVEQVKRLGVDLEFLDIGSGLGIPYKKGEPAPTPQDLAAVVLPIFEKRSKAIGVNLKLIIEPGRYIVGDTTILLTSVNTMKHAAKKFVGVDAGFNLLIRPAMYDSYHHVVVANKVDVPVSSIYTVVGPICETGDILAHNRELPQVEKNDIIALLDAGAYGFSMSSQYNGRPRCAEVLVNDGQVDVIRKAETYDDLLVNQIVPARFL
ncbi:MAG: diaminopimelate decarboxylase [Methanosarcinales archaeon]|nr:diaminopimelate decarboxylase [ANME-2 cluster archaeon]MDF1530799.1 diaminopimelate decarboxylase [ANME-2 cluster archaeon]MDW7777112.1 diaminopimelate decarboxylase [Methanosarcinales archaeon]